MKGRWSSRGLFAGIAVVLTAAAAMAAGPDGMVARQARFAGALDLPVILPDTAMAPQNVLQNPLAELTGEFALSDTLWLDTGYNTDVARMLDRFAPGSDAFDGLFYSNAALSSSYTGLSSGGTYTGLHAKLTEEMHISFGQASSSPGLNRYLVSPLNAYSAIGGRLPYDSRNTFTVLAGLMWNFTRWGGIGLTASQTEERGGVLGVSTPAIGNARTSAIGVNARVNFGGGWVTTASYSEGLTQLALRPGAFAPKTSLRTESFGVAVAKHGLFSKNDALGVAFAQPAPNLPTLTAAPSRNNDLQFFGRDKLLSTMAQETDIELGYKTEFFGDSVALQANASYQMNTGGVTGRDSVSLLSKAKIKF